MSNELSYSFTSLLRKYVSASVLLIISTVLALIVANSPWKHAYAQLWQLPVSLSIGSFNFFSHGGEPLTLGTFINDYLMAIFFLSVGLEIKREILCGELSSVKKALAPVIGACGGMLVPVIVFHLICPHDAAMQRGMAIPMATDIAFSLGVLSVFSKRVPVGLKVFLATLAVADDLGGIIVIAIRYTEHMQWAYLGGRHSPHWKHATGAYESFLHHHRTHPLVLHAGQRHTCHHCRRHPGFLHPGQPASRHEVLYRTYPTCHPQLPRDAGVIRRPQQTDYTLGRRGFDAQERGKRQRPPDKSTARHGGYTEGTCKFLHHTHLRLCQRRRGPCGNDSTEPAERRRTCSLHGFAHRQVRRCLLLTWLFIKMRVIQMPKGGTWPAFASVCMLCGIGFTVSMFMANLSYLPGHAILLDDAKLGILGGSIASAVAGCIMLHFTLPRETAGE